MSKDAIIITPDYRLMPEANGMEILEDVRDFYNWLGNPNNLASYFPEGISADLDHLLVTGESAGGWLALQSALLPSSRERISAVISHYPMSTCKGSEMHFSDMSLKLMLTADPFD